ncbi:GumC family protein [Larkinella terrae]|uniref:Polysaccharide biosynthesis tyrosine autokinase n=1 Tax=Larkinella terrae TaxID=2025311 RepID=A0A7K0EVE1_9BACT|nr:tyrosine-protein kinase family protein [Larkinella terrae]MRS65526.1 polysaccharide biosynthesis tyrosine autokinase [Larkinella terrae]
MNTIPSQSIQIKKLDIHATMMYYAKAWVWFVVSLSIAMISAYFYYSFQSPVYLVEARLLIKDEKKGISEQSILKELEIFTPKKVVENEIEILKSFTLMNRVVGQLGLDVRYYKSTIWGDREIYGKIPVKIIARKPLASLYKEKIKIKFIDNQSILIDGEQYPIGKDINTEFGQLRVIANRSLNSSIDPLIFKFSPRIKTVKDYQKKLIVEPTTKASTVLTLAIEDGVVTKGEVILNQLVKEYNQSAIIDKNKAASNTLDFVENRLKLISKEIAVVEKDVEKYKSDEGITDLSSQGSFFLEKVKENDALLSEVNLQIASLEGLEKYVHNASSNRGEIPIIIGLNDPVLTGLIHKLGTLESEKDQLSQTVGPANPLAKTLQNQIAITKNNISDNIHTTKTMLTTNRRLLHKTNADLEKLVRSIPHKERALLNITRQQAIKNELYTYLLKKREETALSYAAAISDSRTIDMALGSSEPIKPVMRNIFILFGLIGLCLPVALLAIRDSRNNRIVRRLDVESLTNIPIIGEVVESMETDGLIINSQNRSTIGEQIRTLRTNIQFLRTKSSASQVILFTSSISGEGKSYLSLNLGASLSLIGHPTVILEFDMRKPKLEKVLNKHSKRGLSHYLINEAEINDILHPIDGYNNYFLLPCGSIPPNPAEILSSPRLAQLFQELRKRFNYILVDSPPCTLVTDAQLIAPFADITLFIVRHNFTPKSNFKVVENLYTENRFNKMYLIINAITDDDQAYYYNYNYGNYYTSESDDNNHLDSHKNGQIVSGFLKKVFKNKPAIPKKKEKKEPVLQDLDIITKSTSFTENTVKSTVTSLVDIEHVLVDKTTTDSKKPAPPQPIANATPVNQPDELPAKKYKELAYLAVAGNFTSENKALNLLCILLQKGYQNAFILNEDDAYKVIALGSDDRSEIIESIEHISSISNSRALVHRNRK